MKHLRFAGQVIIATATVVFTAIVHARRIGRELEVPAAGR